MCQCQRFLSSGRSANLQYFTKEYQSFIGYVDFLESDIKDMSVKRYYINKAHNETPSMVTAEDAKLWDYSISESKNTEMLKYLYDFMYENKSNISYYDAWNLLYND